jgi:predicted lipoprotein with Yx(FWY)xxD motif
MRHLGSALAGLALLLPVGAALAAANPPPTPAEISLFEEGKGYVFKTNDGLAIYSFAKDTPGKSMCEGQCAQAWPPVAAPAGSTKVGDWTAIARPGGLQWAYKGKPVYTFVKDTASTTTGDGVGGVWNVVKP